jgi:hypothetical protein
VSFTHQRFVKPDVSGREYCLARRNSAGEAEMTFAILVFMAVIVLLVVRVVQLNAQVQAQQREYAELRQQLEARLESGSAHASPLGVVFLIMAMVVMVMLVLAAGA